MAGLGHCFSRELRQYISVIRGFFFCLTDGNCDFSDSAGDDESIFEMNLEAETDIDTAELQETAAEGASRQSGRRELWKKPSASDQNLPSPTGNHRDFISAIFGADVKRFHILHGFQLNAFRPSVG
jgi:hypothetical protein